MNKIFIIIWGLFLTTAGFTYKVDAQACFSDSKLLLKNCVDSAVDVCRQAYPACNKYEPVLSIQDVRTLAIDICCGRNSKSGRALCLKRERTKYTAKRAAGPQRAFFRAARQNVDDIRRNVCRSSSYNLPAESSLF